MSKQAIKYLKQNRAKFPLSQLSDALLKAGYEAQDVQESVEQVYGPDVQAVPQVEESYEQHRFLDFSATWTNYTKSEKILDYFFGMILPWVTLWILWAIDDDLAWLTIGFYLAYLYFFHKRRKYIFRGLRLAIGLTAIVFGIGFVLLWWAFRSW